MAQPPAVIIKEKRGTANGNQTRRVLDISNDIHLLDADNNPLVVFTKKVSKKSCFNPEFKWQEDQFEPKKVTLDAAAIAALGAAGTTYTASAGEENYVQAGDMIIVPGTADGVPASADNYDEILRVTAVDAAGTGLTVQRNFGARATNADISLLAAPVTVYVLGTAFEEGSKSARSRHVKVSIKTNYTEIFKDSFEITGTHDQSEMYGGNDMDRERRKKAIKHMRDIERAFLCGQPKEDLATGTHPIRSTGGLKYWIQSNVTDISGTVNYSDWELFAKQVYRYGDAPTRLLMAGGTLMSAIDEMHHDKLQTFQTEKLHGVNVKRIMTGHGDFLIVRHKQLDDMGMGGDGIAVDMDTVKYRFLRNRDTKLKLNIQENDEDAEKDQFLTECGLEFALEEQSGIIKNVTGFAA